MASDFDTRERILQYAREKFMGMGFSKVTVDEIAAGLGISKKTIYKFYPSKEELLRASVHMTMRNVQEALEHIRSSDKPSAEKLAETMIVIGRQIGRISREIVVDMQRSTPSIWRELERFRREMILDKLVAMVRQARAEGILRNEVDDQVLIQMIISAVQGILNPEVLMQSSFSAEEAYRTIFQVIFAGSFSDDARKGLKVLDKQV
ncbi:MAG: TetR/AcrR family transcriptional regulator [Ignavibacteria bacterium]|nr:TetR/AcrR family transcriptional regulator [Ignavibacteria bacterium]